MQHSHQYKITPRDRAKGLILTVAVICILFLPLSNALANDGNIAVAATILEPRFDQTINDFDYSSVNLTYNKLPDREEKIDDVSQEDFWLKIKKLLSSIFS